MAQAGCPVVLMHSPDPKEGGHARTGYRDVLTEVHRGMKTSRTRHINLGLDAGAMRFRKMVERRIEASPSPDSA